MHFSFHKLNCLGFLGLELNEESVGKLPLNRYRINPIYGLEFLNNRFGWDERYILPFEWGQQVCHPSSSQGPLSVNRNFLNFKPFNIPKNGIQIFWLNPPKRRFR